MKNAIENLSWENIFRNLNTNDMSLYLTNQSKIFYLTTLLLKLLFVTSAIRLGLIKNQATNCSKTEGLQVYIQNIKGTQLSNAVVNLQNQLAVSIEKSKQKYYSHM